MVLANHQHGNPGRSGSAMTDGFPETIITIIRSSVPRRHLPTGTGPWRPAATIDHATLDSNAVSHNKR